MLTKCVSGCLVSCAVCSLSLMYIPILHLRWHECCHKWASMWSDFSWDIILHPTANAIGTRPHICVHIHWPNIIMSVSSCTSGCQIFKTSVCVCTADGTIAMCMYHLPAHCSLAFTRVHYKIAERCAELIELVYDVSKLRDDVVSRGCVRFWRASVSHAHIMGVWLHVLAGTASGTSVSWRDANGGCACMGRFDPAFRFISQDGHENVCVH